MDDPGHSLVTPALDFSVDGAADVVGAIFVDPLQVLLGALDAHHNQLLVPAVQKLLQPQALAEGGVAVKKQIVAVKHIDHRIAFLRPAVIVRQIQMDAPVFSGGREPEFKFLDHTHASQSDVPKTKGGRPSSAASPLVSGSILTKECCPGAYCIRWCEPCGTSSGTYSYNICIAASLILRIFRAVVPHGAVFLIPTFTVG